MTKQVTKGANSAPSTNSTSPQNIFICVKTFENVEGRCIGERVVDLHHYGTRNWLQKHLWWAMCNGHTIETSLATPDEINAYLVKAKEALADKYNSAPKEEVPTAESIAA